jgi:hypothetical protein
MVERREAAKQWDEDRPNTWKHIYIDRSTIDRYSPEEFEVYRVELIHQADLRLSYLREVEAKRVGRIAVNGSDIEDMRARVLKKVQRSAELQHDERQMERYLNAEQRQLVFNLFAEILETASWKFPWWEGMTAVNRYLTLANRTR